MERPYAESKQAIHVWLLENKGEEEIWARRYYQFWGEQPGRNQRYLLVVTSLKLAAEEKVRAQEEEDRQQREKLQSAQRIAGPDGIYTVMAGDTASKIARAFRLKMDQ